MILWIWGLSCFYCSMFSELLPELMSSAVTRHLVNNKCGLSAEISLSETRKIDVGGFTHRFDKYHEVLKYKTKLELFYWDVLLLFYVLLSYGHNQTH